MGAYKMHSAYYVRNLSKVQKQKRLTNLEFCSQLKISLNKLVTLKKGKSTTARIAHRIVRNLKPSRGRKIIVEEPHLILKLHLNPKFARYQVLEYIDPRTLIAPEPLLQALQGHAFTVSFARKLRAFFKTIVVGKDEYSFDELNSLTKTKIVEEWKSSIPSLISGDEFIDLVMLIQERFRTFLEHTSLNEEKHRATKKAGTAQISEVTFLKASFESLSAFEQSLFVAFGLASNELGFLIRLATISGHQTHPGRMHDAFQFSQQMAILKLLAGKIFECWKLVRMRYFGPGLSHTYDKLIHSRTKSDLKQIKRYFDSPLNIIGLFRNEAAFHYSRGEVHKALNDLAGERSCLVYLAGSKHYLELYHCAELAMAGHLLGQVNKDQRKAMRIAQQDIALIGGKLATFFQDVLFCLLQKLIKHSPENTKVIVRNIGLQRKKDTGAIPVFIRPNDYYNEFSKIRRSLAPQRRASE
jgi:hypothetical protein